MDRPFTRSEDGSGLSFQHQVSDGITTLAVLGHIDITTAGELADRIESITAEPANSLVRVDLSRVSFVDSAAVSVLLRGRRLAEQQHRGYQVVGATGTIREVLDLTGVWDLLSGSRTDDF
jgi:anti-anti-sigma factor